MGINTDSQTAKSIRHPVHGTLVQPTITQDTKIASGTGNRNRNDMATIADDDDRLLVRIGYTPVSISKLHMIENNGQHAP